MLLKNEWCWNTYQSISTNRYTSSSKIYIKDWARSCSFFQVIYGHDLLIGNQQKKDMCSRWNKQFPNNRNENRWHPPVVNDYVKLKLKFKEKAHHLSPQHQPRTTLELLTITPTQHHLWPWVLGANYASHWAESSWRIVAVWQSWWWNMHAFRWLMISHDKICTQSFN